MVAVAASGALDVLDRGVRGLGTGVGNPGFGLDTTNNPQARQMIKSYAQPLLPA